LNAAITVLGVIIAIVLMFAEKLIPVVHSDSQLLISVLLLVLTFQFTQILQELALDLKLNELAETSSTLNSLGSERKLVSELVQKVALVQQSHEERARAAGVKLFSPTYSEQRRILTEQTKRILTRAVREVTDLHDGEFKTYFWSCDVLKDAVQNMRRTLIGVSPLVTTDIDWWECPNGKEFLKVNMEALSAQKEIIRIFVVRDNQTDQDHAMLKKHTEAAKEIYTISESELSRKGFRSRYEAMAVVDDTLLFMARTGNRNEHYDCNEFSVNPTQIQERTKELRRIKDAAQIFPPPAPSKSVQAEVQQTRGRES
jgi:hypothetical protein